MVSTWPFVSNVILVTTFPSLKFTSVTDDVSVCPIVIVPAPFVIVTPFAAFSVAILGAPLPSPINNSPLFNTAVDVSALVPFPTTIPPATNVAAPVPPAATDNWPPKLLKLNPVNPLPSPTKYLAVTVPDGIASLYVVPTNNFPDA